MRELVKFTFENDDFILVEVETASIAPSRGMSEKIVTATEHTFESALDSIRPIANAVFTKLKDLITTPEQIQVEFGLKITAQAGAILTYAGGEAHFKVALTWKREE